MQTSSGAFVVNDSVVHMLNSEMPFGGVGRSGYGRWRGKAGFQHLSNRKSICETSPIDMYPLSVRFPPYTPHKQSVFTLLLNYGSLTYGQIGKRLLFVLLMMLSLFAAFKIRPSL